MNERGVSLDKILEDGYLDDVQSRPMDELREMRDACDEIECYLSYNRRLLHGRIDILRDELARRADGNVSTPSELIARLPSILSDAPTAAGATRGNRLVRMMAPAQMQRMERDVEALLGMPLGDIATADESEIDSALKRLVNAEQEVSKHRHVLHQRLDTIQGEMARRYRDGEADVDSLLASD